MSDKTTLLQSKNDTGFDPITGVSMGGMGAKEQEFFATQEALQLEQVRHELELAPEMKEAGMETLHDEVKLPPSLKQIGVQKIGELGNLSQAPAAAVPLADDKIISNTGSSVWASLTWLALWCLKQLKKAHVKLKKIHGKVIRVIGK